MFCNDLKEEYIVTQGPCKPLCKLLGSYIWRWPFYSIIAWLNCINFLSAELLVESFCLNFSGFSIMWRFTKKPLLSSLTKPSNHKSAFWAPFCYVVPGGKQWFPFNPKLRLPMLIVRLCSMLLWSTAFQWKILNRSKIVNVIDIKVRSTCFASATFPLALLFRVQMVFFTKLDPTRFLCRTYSCYVKFVAYHAIPSSSNGMGCHAPCMSTADHPPIRVTLMFGFWKGMFWHFLLMSSWFDPSNKFSCFWQIQVL
jgi:hypothetical protein